MLKSVAFISLVCLFLGLEMARGEKDIPWESRHFPNAPRISAEQAMAIYRSGARVILMDIPHRREDYKKAHVCGSIIGTTKPDRLDRFLKRLPKDVIIIAY